MKKDNININKTSRFLCALSMFIIVFTICTTVYKSRKPVTINNIEYEANIEKEINAVYLSDIDYLSGSRSGWGPLCKDSVAPNGTCGGKIGVRYENGAYTFDKGMWAHASSTLLYDISAYSNEYKYFTAYIGINTTSSSGNGVIFTIQTSNDNNTWKDEEVYDAKPGANAKFVQINVQGKKYLRLVANANGSNGNDHSVYADAKLVKTLETGTSGIKTVEEYDKELNSKYANATLDNKEYELLVLQRNFVDKVGQFALKVFLSTDKTNHQEVFNWLFNDVDNLRMYIMGGEPIGAYANSLSVLSDLYRNYKNDLNNKKLLNNVYDNTLTYGDLYKRMMITLSLTHSSRVALWMQPGEALNQSDAVTRYAIYRELHRRSKEAQANNTTGGFRAANNMDITPWFESLKVEEMRYVMNNLIDDEEILWLNDYVQTRITDNKNVVSSLLTPHPYMAYTWPNYGNPVYYADENKDYFNSLFAVYKTNNNSGKELTDEKGQNTGKVGLFDVTYTIPGGVDNPTYTFKVTRGTSDKKVYKLWMNFRNKFGTGAVCGGISKSGSNIRTTHGIPAVVIGQPGHAALLAYAKDAEGKGYWGIDNDVSGWSLSEKGERLPLGWGNANSSYARGSYQVVYVTLAQEAINDYSNLEKAEETLLVAKTVTDLVKKEKIIREAIKIQPINVDAWLALINLYNESTTKTEDEYYALAEELAESLKDYPLPMYNLTNLIKPKLNNNANVYKFTLLQDRMLKYARNLVRTTSNNRYWGATVTEANYLLGKVDNSIATFSFDGEDAGKIVLSSRFDGNGVRWDYNLGGKDHLNDKNYWKEVSFKGEEEHKLQLTKKELASITSENDIYVHIVGVDYSEKNLFKIDITDGVLPSNLFANDLENRVVGATTTMEWRLSDKDKWTSYSVASPDLTGNKTVEVRVAATKTQLTSNSVKYTFTKNSEDKTRQYIPVSHISLVEVSSEAVKQGGAASFALDANYNTRWHSAWNGSDTNRFMIVKLDKPVYLSDVEYVPAGGGNGKILDGTIYGSMDGKTWEKLSEAKDLKYTSTGDSIDIAVSNIKSFKIAEPKEIQYVKIVADNASQGHYMSRNGNWFTARAFNFYQDLTKNPHPTAGIAYSKTTSTNEPVIARLVNASTNIKITNNNGNDTYVFTENGTFTFEFEDENGNKGTSTAKVTWIDKTSPTVDVTTKLDENNKLVTIIGNISKSSYLLDKNNKKINFLEVKDNKIVSVSYLDSNEKVYKIVELDENGCTTGIEYINTTGKIENVYSYKTVIKDGKIVSELYLDKDGNSISNVSEADKNTLKGLNQTISNPLEYTFEKSDDYEIKLQDIAGNTSKKNVRVDYMTTSNSILVSDITYNITTLTNKDVVASINLKIVNPKDKTEKVIMKAGETNTYTFTGNGTHKFEYKSSLDTTDYEIKENTAKVTWIDKTAPIAKVSYSTTEETKDKVTATLVNPSESIIITNNGGNSTYTFTENGKFTFEFQDKAGNKGTALAEVNWINKNEPVKYYCKVVDGKYYDKNGNVVDKAAYDKSCNETPVQPETPKYYCKVVDGKYYDKNGNVVDKATYDKSCNETPVQPETPKYYCKVIDGKYYDKNGNVVDKTSYEKSCNINKDETNNNNNNNNNTSTTKPNNNNSTNTTVVTKPNANTNNNATSNTTDKNNNITVIDKDNKVDKDDNNNNNINTKPSDNDKVNTDDKDDDLEEVKSEKSSNSVLYYVVSIIIILLISFLITVVYKNRKND